MGMYTEIYVNVNLKEDTPQEIIEILKAMGEGRESELLKDKPPRWEYMFFSGSYYTPNTFCHKLTYDKTGNQWSFLGKGDIKDYGSEIEEFFEWLKPHVEADPEGEFIGYHRYEGDREPTLVYSPCTITH